MPMLDKDLQRHAREFSGYIAKHDYDMTDEGVYFPKAGAVAAGEYFFDTNGERPEVAKNLLTTQALNYLLEAGVRDGPKQSAWYLALFSNPYTPTAAIEADDFAATAGEIVSATEGYAESTRRPWTVAPASGGLTDNTAARAAFTIATATSLTIRGAAVLSDPTKGGTNGVLLSIARFPNDRIEYAGNVFNLGYRVRLRQPT